MHTIPTSGSSQAFDPSRSVSSSLTAFVCALAGAAVTSRVVFHHQPPGQPEDVVVYIATLGATVMAGWWLANVAAWTVAIRRGIQVRRFTLPGSKRIAQIVLAATLSTSCVADAANDPVMVLVEQAPSADSPALTTTAPSTTTPSTTAPSTTAPSTTTVATTTPSTTAPTTTVPPTIAPSEPEPTIDEPAPSENETAGVASHQIVVNEGDNLWSLAAETLQLHGIDAPTTGQVAEYWRLVVAANRVRSGNPDLIVAGEALTMPAFVFHVPGTSNPSPEAAPSQTSGIAVR